MYWRLLSTDPEAAKDIVLAEKPTISDEASGLDPDLLNELIRNIATLSSVDQKPPAAFVSHLPAGAPPSTSTPSVVSEEQPAPSHTNDSSAPVPSQPQVIPDMLQDEPAAAAPAPAPGPASQPAGADLLGDLMGLDAAAPAAAAAAPV